MPMPSHRLLRCACAAALLLAAALPLRAADLTLFVNSSGDLPDADTADGQCETILPAECTLRAAIEQALQQIQFNPAVGSADIQFEIPPNDPNRVQGTDPGSGLGYTYWRITIASPLPPINRANLRILGSSQPASSPLGNPTILLRGSGSASTPGNWGFRILAGNITLSGMAMQAFGRAIWVSPSGVGTLIENVRFERNWIGLPLPQTESGHGNVEGILIAPTNGGHASRVTIGGSSAGTGNWIGGNTQGGIVIYGRGSNLASNQVSQINVFGNRIGIDPVTGAALGNHGAGVFVQHASTVTIGGDDSVRRNIIAASQPGPVAGFASTQVLPGLGIYWGVGASGGIRGNHIGTDIAGSSARANADDGIRVLRSAGETTIGGSTAGARNVISGNGGSGLHVEGNGSTLELVVDGNAIGTRSGGGSALPNQGYGVRIGGNSGSPAALIRVGGSTGNLISGNAEAGIGLTSAMLDNTEIRGNRIGLADNGLTPLPNLAWGVAFMAPAAGTMDVFSDNFIAANGEGGVLVHQASVSSDIALCGNLIGLAADGQSARGNQGPGIRIRQTNSGQLGGILRQSAGCATPNLIAHNLGPGLSMDADAIGSIGNASGMRFRDNQAGGHGLAIDLGADGPTANDPSDSDGGPNRRQNFPDLGAVALNGAGTTLAVSFRVDSLSGSSAYPLRVDFYADDGNGQGLDLIGHAEYLEGDIGQIKQAQLAATPALLGRGLVALATAADGRSSEFSRPRRVIGNLAQRTLMVSRSGLGSGSVQSTPAGILCTAANPSGCVAGFADGTAVNLDASAFPGSVFSHWSGACMGNVPSCNGLLMDQDRSVNAAFAVAPTQHALTVQRNGQGLITSQPAGIHCGGSCQANFNAGQAVQLSASAEPGWVFIGWQGPSCNEGQLSATCSFTLQQPTTATASFTQPDAIFADGFD